MDTTRADPRIGAVLGGRYRITTLLGEGGMGLVYRGERLQLGRPVAIKFLHSPYARSPKFVARFEREARAMSKLSHPHCVSVIDFGVQDAPYIVMDFVTGSTLREVLDQGPLTMTRSLSIVRQVLFGLAHAHSEGVIHRDIKPGNVMLAELTGIGDHVRIFDFGLAKLHDAETDGDASTAAIVGTPAYMAPEQARADKIDTRADLYATGVLLFEMLAGQKPFQGADAYTVLCMQRDTAPPKLREMAPQCSPELEAVVARALEKDVQLRFQTATEFVAALDQVPEAKGASGSTEPAEPLAFAKTEYELKAPVIAALETPPTAPMEVAASEAKPQKPTERRTTRRVWFSSALMLAVLLGAGLWLLRGPLMKLAERPGPAGQPRGEGAPRPRASGDSFEASARTVGEEPAAALAQAATELNEPSASTPASEADAAEAEPTPTTDEHAQGSDELSEAALAEADEQLNETREHEVEVDESVPPVVTSIAGVRRLIRQNQLDAAITAIQSLRKKSPKNPELPYMLGEVYFDRGWWSDGLAKYREAIRLQSSYRQRSSIQRNAIRALADDRTYPKARALLVKDVGRAALSSLRRAAKSDASRTVRKRASSVLAQVSR